MIFFDDSLTETFISFEVMKDALEDDCVIEGVAQWDYSFFVPVTDIPKH